MGRPPLVMPLLICGLLLTAATAVSARPLFTAVTLANGAPVGTVNGTNSLRDLQSILDPVATLDAFIQGGGVVTSVLDLRGLPIVAAFRADGAESVLTVILGNETLIELREGTIEETLQDLEDLVRGTLQDPNASASEALTGILQGLLANSPVDPVAGNPNSLQTRMLMSDWDGGLEGPLTSGRKRISGEDLFRLGLDYSYSQSGDWDVDTLSLPLGYRANFSNPKWSFLMDLPITATNTGDDAWSVFGSFGLGLQYRPFGWWALTPMLRIGAAGSLDVGALAVLYGATLTSHIRVPLGPVRLGIGNTLGFNKSVDDITISDINVAYNLTNGVFRNGGYIEGDFTERFGWKFFGSDIRYCGTDLFTEYTDEVGVGIQTFGRIGGRRYDQLALTASYVFARQYDGLWLKLRWRF